MPDNTNDTKTTETKPGDAAAKAVGVNPNEPPRSAAEKTVREESGGPVGFNANPFPDYNVMDLDTLRKIADDRNVAMPPDVEKAHLISALRAADTGTGYSYHPRRRY